MKRKYLSGAHRTACGYSAWNRLQFTSVQTLKVNFPQAFFGHSKTLKMLLTQYKGRMASKENQFNFTINLH